MFTPVAVLSCRRSARIAAGLLIATLAAASPAAAQLAKVETDDLRLVFVSPSEDFLVPQAVRTFLNSQAFLKKLFDYHPDEKTTVLFADFGDYGNAGASSVPHNGVRIQVAPLNFSFETIMANERINAIMNHELVHVIAMDQSTGRDRVFRRLFGGKVVPVDAQPESILYFYLTSPRVAAPRWYHEGARCSSTRGDGRHRPRAERLGRNGVAVDGARRRAFLRSAGAACRGHEDRLPGRGELVPVRRRGS